VFVVFWIWLSLFFFPLSLFPLFFPSHLCWRDLCLLAFFPPPFVTLFLALANLVIFFFLEKERGVAFFFPLFRVGWSTTFPLGSTPNMDLPCNRRVLCGSPPPHLLR